MCFRETLIFCVRQVFSVAGSKVSEPVCKSITQSLAIYLGSDHDGTRLVSAGALAAMLPYMTQSELKTSVTSHIMGKMFAIVTPHTRVN